MSQLVEFCVRSQRLTLAFRFKRWLVNPKMMSASTKNVPKSIILGFCLSDPDDPLEFCKSILQLCVYFLAQFTENVEKSSLRSSVPSRFTDGYLWFQTSAMVLSRGSLSGTSNCWLIQIVRFLFQITCRVQNHTSKYWHSLKHARSPYNPYMIHALLAYILVG